MESTSKGKVGNLLVVKDNAKVIELYIGMALLGLIGVLCILGAIGAMVEFLFKGPRTVSDLALFAGVFVAGIFLLGLARLQLRIAKAKAKGFVIDTEEQTLEFCELTEENDLSELFTLDHWRKMYTRQKIDLTEILQMSRAKILRGQTATFTLELQGTFGTLEFPFQSEGKRDQLASYIRSINQMGAPVLNV